MIERVSIGGTMESATTGAEEVDAVDSAANALFEARY